MKPYIGVTGLSQDFEVAKMVQCAKNLSSLVMFGFTSTYNRMQNPKSRGRTSPPIDDLEKLVSLVPDTMLPMIHFFTPKMEVVGEELEELFFYCNFTDKVGVQINSFLPSVSQIELFRKAYPNSPVSIEITEKLLEDFSNDDILSRVKDFGGLVQYLMVSSKTLTSQTVHLIERIAVETPLIPGLSRGLSGENIDSVVDSLSEVLGHSMFSVEAESKIRTNESFDLDKAQDFLLKADRSFNHGKHE